MSNEKHYSPDLNDFLPFHQIPEKFPHLYSERSWCWAVKNRADNGLAPAFRKVGKNLFVNVVKLAECIDDQPA